MGYPTWINQLVAKRITMQLTYRWFHERYFCHHRCWIWCRTWADKSNPHGWVEDRNPSQNSRVDVGLCWARIRRLVNQVWLHVLPPTGSWLGHLRSAKLIPPQERKSVSSQITKRMVKNSSEMNERRGIFWEFGTHFQMKKKRNPGREGKKKGHNLCKYR
jgi:hypothetical protein